MDIFKSVVEITVPYFGLGAQKFVERQVRVHLGIQPTELTINHLDELAKWCQVSGKLFLQDEKAANEIRIKVLNLKT